MIKFLQFIVVMVFTVTSVIAMFMMFIFLYPMAALKYKMENFLAGVNHVNIKKPR